jgi:polar amino acid transport system substrate-binding protein
MKRVLSAAFAATLFLAACGSDAADEPTTTEAAAAEEVTETSAAEATETSAAEATETTAAAVTETTAAATETTAAAAASSGSAQECAAGKTITDGTLTIATGEPAFPPYVIDDKPESGEGFEAAVAAAVAKEMGFAPASTKWVRTTFDAAIAPGPKDFDFNLQQYTVTAERKAVVDFSDGYYSAAQAVFGLSDSAAASAKTVADLQKLKIGVAAGTTSLTYAEETIKPTEAVQVFNDNAAVKTALQSKQIDAVVADLPTALFITGVEIEGTKVFGQIAGSGSEEFGLLLSKDNPLTECVNLAIGALKTSGELDTITTKWMSEFTSAPVITG